MAEEEEEDKQQLLEEEIDNDNDNDNDTNNTVVVIAAPTKVKREPLPEIILPSQFVKLVCVTITKIYSMLDKVIVHYTLFSYSKSFLYFSIIIDYLSLSLFLSFLYYLPISIVFFVKLASNFTV